VDWVLEGVALAAVAGAVALAVVYFPILPDYARWARPGWARWLSVPNVLLMLAFISAASYAGLTVAARGGRLFEIPQELERRSPHVRQMLFSMVIVMKTVLALFAAYLVWSLVQVGLRRGTGVSGGFLMLFTLAVPLPLVVYTVKLRRYGRAGHHSSK
jgi:hypothetical protein